MADQPSPFATIAPWDAVAPGYATDATAITGPVSREALRIAGVGPSSEIVDVATGPGTLALAASPRVRSVHALDFSNNMLHELRTRMRDLGVDNVVVECGDGQALPFPDRRFDAAFSMFGLMFFPDRARGFRELFRVLRPSGTAVVSSWAPVEQSPLMQLMFGALQAADPTRAPPQTNLLSLENPELFESELKHAGFEQVAVVPYVVQLTVGDPLALWESLVRSSAPIVMLRQRIGDAAFQQQSVKAVEFLRSQLGSQQAELSTTAFLGSGRRPANA